MKYLYPLKPEGCHLPKSTTGNKVRGRVLLRGEERGGRGKGGEKGYLLVKEGKFR